MNLVGTTWLNLTAPAASVTSPLVARRLRVLATGCLTVVGLGVPLTTAQLVIAPERFMGDPRLVYLAYLVIALLYFGARSRLWSLALWSFVVAGTLGMWLMLGSSHSEEELIIGAPLALLPFVFGALLHRRVAMVLVAALSAAGLAYVALRVPGVHLATLAQLTVVTSLVAAAIAGVQELARADHSDLSQRTRELEEAWHAARVAEEARGRFLATVHHELRTPLNGVLGASLLLRECVDTDDQRELVDAVHDSGQRLHRLVEDVLTFVADGVGELSMDSDPTWVGTAIDDILARHANLAAARGITLTHDDGDAPQLLLDEGRLRHVLTHLVRNAMTFTENGRVVVRSRWQDERLTIQVQDSGVGMTPLQLEVAFSPLRQDDDTSTRAHEGLGLGLSTSRAVAEAMGGTLEATSEPGVGTTFTLTLPGRRAEATAA
jgi:signal transduction histidine kinase